MTEESKNQAKEKSGRYKMKLFKLTDIAKLEPLELTEDEVLDLSNEEKFKKAIIGMKIDDFYPIIDSDGAILHLERKN